MSKRRRRSRRGPPGLVRQVDLALKSLLKIGESRHEAKRAGIAAESIFSWGTFRRYLSYCSTFARYCKQTFGIRLLKDINQTMCSEYFTTLMRRGISPYTQHAIRSALRKLETGILHAFKVNVQIVQPDLLLPPRRLSERKRSGAYSYDEAVAILTQVKQQIRNILLCQAFLGLRLSEVIYMHNVDMVAGLVTTKGKGGLVRQVPIPNEARDWLKHLIAEVEPGQRLFKLSRQTVERAVRQACDTLGIKRRGTHGFRHMFAQTVHRELLQQGFEEKAARAEVSKFLGHRRTSVTYAYVPRRPS